MVIMVKKLGYGLQDGLNGGNNGLSEYGLTVGKKLNDVFSNPK